MTTENLQISLVFPTDDQAWVRRTGVVVPPFWAGHSVAPSLGDVLRLGGRQFIIQARVWEYNGTTPVLRLYLGSGHAQTDTSFG